MNQLDYIAFNVRRTVKNKDVLEAAEWLVDNTTMRPFEWSSDEIVMATILVTGDTEFEKEQVEKLIAPMREDFPELIITPPVRVDVDDTALLISSISPRQRYLVGLKSIFGAYDSD